MLNNYTLIILALIFPPIPVVLKKGIRDYSVLINLIWHFLGYIPAVLHSIFVITKEIQTPGIKLPQADSYYYKCPSYPLVDMRCNSEDSTSTTCIEENDDDLKDEEIQVIQMV